MEGFLVTVGVLLALGMMLSASKRDRLRVPLLMALPIAAMVFVVGVLKVDDVIGNSDCVGTCIDSFDYNAPWIVAAVGGFAFATLLIVALVRAIPLDQGERDT